MLVIRRSFHLSKNSAAYYTSHMPFLFGCVSVCSCGYVYCAYVFIKYMCNYTSSHHEIWHLKLAFKISSAATAATFAIFIFRFIGTGKQPKNVWWWLMQIIISKRVSTHGAHLYIHLQYNNNNIAHTTYIKCVCIV